MTKTFQAFVQAEHFECIFCRKSDPESKGKVENVVKYVKYNFLRGRTFVSIEQLNEERPTKKHFLAGLFFCSYDLFLIFTLWILAV
jgi:transposase